jgi:MYXO-CTERM domain-containing protein
VRVGITLAAIGALLARAEDAHACRCGGPEAQTPAAGATDVPTNLAEIVITGFSNFGPVTLESATTSIPLGPSDTQMYTFQVHRFPLLASLQPETEYSIRIGGPRHLGNGNCSLEVLLEQGETTCFEIRARDLAGNVGPPTTRCEETRACSDIDSYQEADEVMSDPQSCPIGGGCSTTRPGGGLLVLVIAGLALRRRRATA